MKLICLSCAWIAGIYLGSKVGLPLYACVALFVLALLVISFGHNRQAFLWGGLCFIVLLGALFRLQYTPSEPTLQLYNEQGIVEIKGTVAQDPKFEGKGVSFRLSAQEIKINEERQTVSGILLIRTRSFPIYSYGDLLQVSGELRTPYQFGDFDYPAWLAKQDIYSIMFYPEIELVGKGWLFSLRESLSQSLTHALPQPQSSLAQALLLGIRSYIPNSLMDDFRHAGTAHLIAISGLHLSILAGIFLSLGAWLFGRHRPTYLLVALASIWVYALLTGLRPPAFRAAIMVSLFLAALWLGRPYSAMPPLTLAAAIMVGIDPQLLWDVAFQLSFAAVAGLVLLMPPLQTLGRRGIGAIVGDNKKAIATISPIIGSFAVTLAAIIATFPLIAYYFHYVSFVGLPATFFALLALPAIVITVLATAVLGLFAPPLSQAVGWLAWLFLSYVIEVVHGFGALPFASQQIGSISGNIVWAYYGLGAGALWIIPSRKRLGASLSKAAAWGQKGLDRFAELTVRLPRKEWVFTFTLLAAALVWLAVIVAPPKQLEVSFLDVKQGDAILAQTPNGQQILIDGGPDPREVSLKLGQKFPFWDKSIDVVVLTHPHDDHLVGLIEVLRRYEVGQVLEPKLDYTSPAYSEWHKLVAEKNIKHIWAQAGQYIELGDGIRMQVLNPQAELFEGTASDIDNNGVVLRLVKDEVSFLLTADIHDEAEWKLLYQGRELRSTVLKVGHHGGRDSTSAQFLAVVDPEIAVISVGENNPFGHPHEETLARLEKKISENKIYLTSKQGTITFTTDGERLWVKTEH